ncbi:MAG: hypothetical protein R3E76_05185 [Planctomycetota bacterium]
MTASGARAEELLAGSNEWHFQREFTFSCAKLSTSTGSEEELADNVVAIGRTLVLIQIKERNPAFVVDEKSERKWFNNKVEGKALKQIRRSLRLLEEARAVQLTNRRGHRRTLDLADGYEVHLLVVHVPQQDIPIDCFFKKYHISKTCGFVHFFPAQEYEQMLLTLQTPAEVSAYLKFRQEVIRRWPEETYRIREEALLGQFVAGDFGAYPTKRYGPLLHSLNEDESSWSISHILADFEESLVDKEDDDYSYYKILEALALLDRAELREFKVRWMRIVEDVKKQKAAQPYRMGSVRTGCAFVFLPVVEREIPRRTNLLQAYTLANKHQLRMPKAMGISCNRVPNGTFDFQWCWLDEPWCPDPELDALLASGELFRNTWVAPLENYDFDEESRAP